MFANKHGHLVATRFCIFLQPKGVIKNELFPTLSSTVATARYSMRQNQHQGTTVKLLVNVCKYFTLVSSHLSEVFGQYYFARTL